MLIEGLKRLAFWSLAASLATLSFSNSLFEISSGVYLGTALIVLVGEKRWDVFKNAFAAFCAVYLLAVVLSVFQSSYLENSLKGLFRVLRCVLLCLLAPHVVETKDKFKVIFYVLVFTAGVVGLDALWQAFTGTDVIRGRGMTPFFGSTHRVTGPFHHANDFSGYLSLVLFIFGGMIWPFYKRKDWKRMIFFGAGTVLIGVCLLWTYARGAWLAVGGAFVMMVFMKRSRFLMAALAAVLLTAFFLSPPAVKERIASLWDSVDGTATERRLLWRESLDMIEQRPWLGFGVNTYSKVEPQFKSPTIYTDNQYAHNGYLQIAAETGLLGLGSFLAVLACFFLMGARGFWGPREDFTAAGASSLVFGILAFLLHSATDTDLQSLRLVSFFWLSMGLVLAAKKMMARPAL